ncbi:MAG TPA: protein kinase [Pirellulales bacterium]|nr:protein kinase [Pirellulales bacterium]
MAAIEAHVSRCSHACRPLVDSFTRQNIKRNDAATPHQGRNDPTASHHNKSLATPPEIPLASEPVRRQQFGRFEIIEVLGKGTFGTVYRARDTQLGRDIALKIPRKGLLQGDAERERFLREARAAATLHHPNICPIHEAGELDGRQYIVMALIDGQPLTTILDSGRPLGERSVVSIVRKLALALDEAHRKGIVHRDIKPGNIMIDRRGQPVVMDFGLARRFDVNEATLTASGALIGTPAYMSPEQASSRHDEVGPATDIYTLGIVLYEMLTGCRPFQGDTNEVLGQIVETQPSPPSALHSGLDTRLDAICLRAIAKRPRERYGSMREFAEALRDYLKATDPSQSGGIAGLDAPEFTELVSGLNMQLSTIAKRQHIAWWKWTAATISVAFVILLGFLLLPRGPLVVTNIGVDARLLADATLSFFLDDREITAKQAREPMELPPGDHELIVKREETVIKHYRFHVAPPPSLAANTEAPVVQSVELREIKEVAVVQVPAPTTHWSFDSEAKNGANEAKVGTTAADTFGRVQSVRGVVGQAAAFSGLSDAVVIPDDPNLHAKSAVTVAAWVLPTSARAGNIAGRWSSKGSYMLSWADGIYSFRVAFPVGGPTGTPLTVQSFGTAGEWSHVAGVYDGERLNLYIDGQPAASQNLSRSEMLRRTSDFARRGTIPTALQDSSQPFEVGSRGFQGTIDEVYVWNTSLSPEQVATLFEAYTPPPPTTFKEAPDANRRIAEWVIARGGIAALLGPGESVRELKTIIEIPSEPFTLFGVSLFDALSPTDEDLARLDELPTLKSIDIRNTSNATEGILTEEGILRFIQTHPFLTHIAVADHKEESLLLTDALLEAACECPSLFSLTLRSTKLTDAGTVHLEKRANQLTQLFLTSSINLTNLSLSHIKTLRHLTHLSLNSPHLTESALLDLPQLPNLQAFVVWGANAGDQLASRLADNHSLRQLGMAYTKITDAGLEPISKMDTLLELDLTGAAISDAALPHLNRLKSLTFLHLDNTKLTRAGVDELRSAHPQCDIQSAFGNFGPHFNH